MLKKECCKKCLQNQMVVGWTVNDDIRWKAGYVWCPETYDKYGLGGHRNQTEQPPQDCPYYLENIL